MQPSAIEHRGLLTRLIRIDELIGKAKLHAEIEAGLFLGKEGVRSGFSHNLTDPVRDDLSSPGCVGFEDGAVDGKACSGGLLVQRKSGGQAGNAPAHDHDCAWSSHD